jgi:hypothetical protein
MATNSDLVRALRAAAQSLLDRSLTDTENQQLIELFNKAAGTHHERAKEALRRFTGLRQVDIEKRASASDNTDRVIRDLENVIDDWKPGT